MQEGGTEHLDAKYIDGSKGRLFCLRAGQGTNPENHVSILESAVYEPLSDGASAQSKRQLVLFIQPFGEEVNLCRRFYSLARAQLTQAGVVCFQPDHYGTGDSEGCLSDADWGIWQDDLVKVIQHLDETEFDRDTEVSLSIVAVRSGCLLVAGLAKSSIALPERFTLERLVFVQPEHSGYDNVNRLFRARIMAQRLGGDNSQSSSDLWAQIDVGENVYAGGQLLSSRLCQSLRHQTLDDVLGTPIAKHQLWFDVQSLPGDERPDNSPESAWEIYAVYSPLFWQAYDSEPDAALIDAVVNSIVR